MTFWPPSQNFSFNLLLSSENFCSDQLLLADAHRMQPNAASWWQGNIPPDRNNEINSTAVFKIFNFSFAIKF